MKFKTFKKRLQEVVDDITDFDKLSKKEKEELSWIGGDICNSLGVFEDCEKEKIKKKYENS